MNITEIKDKLFTDDAFVLEETKKIQYTYGLKHETRYIVERNEEIQSESVAEHIYALHILADYFLPLEDPEQALDWNKIHDMIQYHDIAEIETGDKIGYLKSDKDREEEAEAAIRVIGRFPEHMQAKLQMISAEYEEQRSSEARIVKAMDRMESIFQLFSDNGKKIYALQKITQKQCSSHKDAIIKPYPYINRFNTVIKGAMEEQGFFYKENATL